MAKMNLTEADKLMNGLIKLTNSKLFVKKTVKELLSGYIDPLLEIVNTILPELVPTADILKINFLFIIRKMRLVFKILQS